MTADLILSIAALWFVGACGWLLDDLRRRALGALAITLAFCAFTYSTVTRFDQRQQSVAMPRITLEQSAFASHAMPFVADPLSKTYHAAGSPCLNDSERPRMHFSSEAEAENSGKEPCERCLFQ